MATRCKKSLRIYLAVLIQYRPVTDGRTSDGYLRWKLIKTKNRYGFVVLGPVFPRCRVL